MENRANYKWFPIMFFSFSACLFLWLTYNIAVSTQVSGAYGQSGSDYAVVEEFFPAPGDTIILALDTETRVRKKRFVYRGIEKKTIKIEVIIPALDPDIGYMYTIPIKEAEKRFNLSGQFFKLVSFGKNRVKISRLV